MKHVSQKSLPFLASKNIMNEKSLLTRMDHSGHCNSFNTPAKNITNFLLVGLLITSSFIVGSSTGAAANPSNTSTIASNPSIPSVTTGSPSNDSGATGKPSNLFEYEKWNKAFNTSNNTPLEKTANVARNAAIVATSMSVCSYIVDNVLAKIDTKNNIPQRGACASTACATLHAYVYASFKYEEFKTNEEIKNAPVLQLRQKSQSQQLMQALQALPKVQFEETLQVLPEAQSVQLIQKAKELQNKVNKAGWYGWWDPSSIK